ncbi:protein NRT1/ PTR FAMILY 7.3-like [Prosopis cineraria]|uniref:protein NRT1/ PTR FAMILY 7.3-like n=1 Tax=Prosopis cineraria TaxID=364024 RepID=UPI00241036BE|nr:protein NRT1/ PTR FAMILY 7.3-like [Prosopis cineraria]
MGDTALLAMKLEDVCAHWSFRGIHVCWSIRILNGQAPDRLKSFGSALYMTSMSLGNYASSLIVAIVMKISHRDGKPGWIPRNLNKGRLDKFYFLLATLTVADLTIYIACAKGYRHVKFEERSDEENNC